MKHTSLLAAILAAVCQMAIADEAAQQSKEEAAVRAAVDAYVAAYNRGDAKAVAQFWSDQGVWVSPSGQRTQGRDAIRKELESMFTENKGLHIEVLDSSIRLVKPEVAVEEGRVRVISPKEAPSESTYIAIQVKQGGKWKLDSVRETEVPDATPPASPLKELQWLVGDWVDKSAGATAATSVAWTKNQTFLTYSFKASAAGMDDLEGTQVIGWDPAAETIRSWMFDSDGGFGEGTWSKKGNSWVVKFSQVLPDGRKASATNIYTPVDENTFTWQSIGRQVDGQFLPNVEPVTLVRKTAVQAEPAAKKPGKREAKK
jgi:uncharacterized protein (TIGR02246 family)